MLLCPCPTLVSNKARTTFSANSVCSNSMTIMMATIMLYNYGDHTIEDVPKTGSFSQMLHREYREAREFLEDLNCHCIEEMERFVKLFKRALFISR